MDDTIPECPLQFLIKRYEYSLKCASDYRGKRAFMLGDYSDWEDHVYDEVNTYDPMDIALTEDPAKKARLMQRLSEYLRSIPHVFISENAYCCLERILESLKELDPRERFLFRLMSTIDVFGYGPMVRRRRLKRTAIDYRNIIERERKLGAEHLSEGRYVEAADTLIALLFSLKLRALADGWRLADEPEAQKILNRLGDLFRNVMDSEELKNSSSTCEKQWILPSGYVRRSAKNLKLNIPDAIVGLVAKWTVESTLDNYTRAVLYHVVFQLNRLLEGTEYDQGIPFGEVPAYIRHACRHEKIHIMDIDTYTERKKREVEMTSHALT